MRCNFTNLSWSTCVPYSRFLLLRHFTSPHPATQYSSDCHAIALVRFVGTQTFPTLLFIFPPTNHHLSFPPIANVCPRVTPAAWCTLAPRLLRSRAWRFP